MKRPPGEIRLENNAMPGDEVILSGEALSSLLLWEPRAGEAFTLAGPSGTRYRARLLKLKTGLATLQIFEAFPARPAPRVLLLMALPEKERMELIIEKTTELGVTAILPFRSTRSITLEERESRQKKAHKWPEIARKAARQSRRASIPRILEYTGFYGAMKAAFEAGKECEDRLLKIMLHENERQKGLRETLHEAAGQGIKDAVILCGPEGGFTREETREARGNGFLPVTLGPRILRTETAAIFATGLVIHELKG